MGVAVLASGGWPPLWFRLTAAAGLLLAMIVFVLVLNSITTHAFTATQEGVDLGLPVFSRRRGRQRRGVRHPPWRHIERGRLAPRAFGARIKPILSPNALPAPRGFADGRLRRLGRSLLVPVPVWYLLPPPGPK